MKKRVVIWCLFLIFLLAPFVSASISVEITPVRDTVLPNENATFNVRITNHGKAEDMFRISTDDIGWNIESYPGVIKISGSSSERALITVTPMGKKTSSAYSIKLLIYSTITGMTEKEELIIKSMGYTDMLSVKLEIPPGGLDVEKEDSIKLILKNKYGSAINNLKINLINDIFTLETSESLDANQEKEIKIPVSLKKTTPNGLYNTNILITKGDIVYTNKTAVVNVGPYSNVKQNEIKEDKFLISKTIISKTNVGNSNVYETYSLEVGSLERKFTSFEPKPTRKEDNVYEWEFTLKPGQTYTITSTKNYRSPIITMLVMIIVICLLYFWLRSPVSIKKKILTIKNEEGLSEMKVLLIIKNNSPQEIKEVKVMDMLPKIMREPTEFGTIKPRMVKKGENNTLLFWEIPSLMKGEERVLSYRIKSKIKIVGKLVIPRAMCSYRGKITKKKSTTSSNRHVFFS